MNTNKTSKNTIKATVELSDKDGGEQGTVEIEFTYSREDTRSEWEVNGHEIVEMDTKLDMHEINWQIEDFIRERAYALIIANESGNYDS